MERMVSPLLHLNGESKDGEGLEVELFSDAGFFGPFINQVPTDGRMLNLSKSNTIHTPVPGVLCHSGAFYL